MEKKLLNYLNILALLVTVSIYGQTVTNQSTLNSAISNAGPGTTIILANGTWTNATISISKNGADGNPITIKAETPGMVFFTGNTSVKLGGAYIHFEGVVFKDAPATVSTGTAIIDFRVNSSNIGAYCEVTNVKIDGFNQNTSQQATVFKWVVLRGHHNEISYSSFVGKHGVGSIINDNRDYPSIENYHKIHHNYFANRTPQGTSAVNDTNDQDAIRLGNSQTSVDDVDPTVVENSFTEVYDNYFYNFVGEIEVISNKSGGNKYYNNTFEDYSGALTLRHGNNCEVFNNFFLANPTLKLFSGGVRLMGEGHKIYNNYVEGTRSRKGTSLSNGLGGINIANGRTDGVVNGYYPVKNATIVNNTFVNCDYGIRVGTLFSGSQSVAPGNVIIGNNIIFLNTTIANASDNRAIQVVTQLTGASSMYENNIKQSGTWDSFGSVTATGNIDVTSGLLASTDFYRIETGSAAIDYGAGSYAFLTEDIIGGTRPANFDAGAEEFGAGGTLRPYKQTDVGVTVGYGGSPTLDVDENRIDQNSLRIYPVPTKGHYLNLSLEKQNLGEVQIIDMLGRTVIKTYFNTPKGQIDIHNLNAGSYVVKVKGISKMIAVQ